MGDNLHPYHPHKQSANSSTTTCGTDGELMAMMKDSLARQQSSEEVLLAELRGLNTSFPQTDQLHLAPQV